MEDEWKTIGSDPWGRGQGTEGGQSLGRRVLGALGAGIPLAGCLLAANWVFVTAIPVAADEALLLRWLRHAADHGPRTGFALWLLAAGALLVLRRPP